MGTELVPIIETREKFLEVLKEKMGEGMPVRQAARQAAELAGYVGLTSWHTLLYDKNVQKRAKEMASTELIMASMLAVETLVSVLREGNSSARLRAAESILDRSQDGLTKTQVIEVKREQTLGENLRELARLRGEEAARQVGRSIGLPDDVIDAEFAEVAKEEQDTPILGADGRMYSKKGGRDNPPYSKRGPNYVLKLPEPGKKRNGRPPKKRLVPAKTHPREVVNQINRELREDAQRLKKVDNDG